ncbi:carbon-nitrogen hydrolase family protein [Thalassotalea sp. PLHSN55]|uniref:carbon-nitrogen hydrolase family protein n=1 Tax=Thalassotalea sp. PLHSN55 TaxID=3435888 RepID=UPI003F877A5B
MVRLSAIQLNSTPDIDENLAAIEYELSQLPKADEHIVVLPECCLYFGGSDGQQLQLAKDTLKTEQLTQALAELALRYKVYLVAGTMPLLSEACDKFTNSCCVFSPQGELIQQYNKIHLFDVVVQDNEKNYLESKYTQAGTSVEVVKTAQVTLGLSVCYDLRFPELFRQLRSQGADVICVPSAFTRVTGKAHWQPLLQARAIENQAYVIAAGQEGEHANGRQTWGHSMIISPWGEILSVKASGQGAVSALFDRQELEQIRTSIPVSQHNQFKTELISYE